MRHLAILMPPRRYSVPVFAEGRQLHLSRRFWLVLALGLSLAAGLALHGALEPPGQRIRSELEAAAADLQSAPALPSERALQQLRRHFRDHDVTIDTSSWPVVSVTFRRLSAIACRQAAVEARRIDGLVVIALEGCRTTADCREDGDMTWRLMP